jgi:hypothetical protein
MPMSRNLNQFVPGGKRNELARLIRRIQTLTLERDQLRQDGGADRELQAKERTLDQLHWRLATVARQTAVDDLGNAA